MPYVPEELIHSKQVKVRLLPEDYEAWVAMCRANKQLHSVMVRAAMRGVLEEYRRTGEIPDIVKNMQA